MIIFRLKNFYLAAGVVLCASSCTEPNPYRPVDARQDDNDASENPDARFVDASQLDASPDGATCNSADCPLGCHPTEPRCNDVAPSNGLGPYLDMAAQGSALVIPDGSTIDTTDGSIADEAGGAILSTSVLVDGAEGGADIRVFPVKSLVLGDTIISGDGDPSTADPAVAFVSDGDIVISGVVVITAGSLTTAVCRGEAGLCSSGGTVNRCGGNGGNGFGSPGGNGDALSSSQSGGTGGSVDGNAELVPLRGGCGLESFDDNIIQTGGGAIQLASRTAIRIETGGFLDLNGHGGFDSIPSQTVHIFGGGSGGGALLEAPEVTVATSAGITANGGAGSGNCSGAEGDDGQRSLQPANGGQCSGGTSTGGDGAASSVAATDGTDGGSGGGGVGRIRINTSGQVETETGSVLSPSPSVGGLATR